jgi:hypothetical protein
MSIPQRFYRIARYKLSELKERFDRMDEEARVDWEADQKRRHGQYSTDARRELDDAVEGSPSPPAAAAPERPAATPGPLPRRTPDEIARGVRPPAPSPAPRATVPSQTAGPVPPDPLLYHYRLLGVEPGSDFTAVQGAYNRLAARCDSSRFPAGSKEEREARQIRERLEGAFQALRDALDPTARRFDLLEFDDAPKPPLA